VYNFIVFLSLDHYLHR